MTYSPNSHCGLGWARLKPGTKNCVSHVGAETQTLGQSASAFPGASAESSIRSGEAETPVPVWDASMAGGELTHCTTTPTLHKPHSSLKCLTSVHLLANHAETHRDQTVVAAVCTPALRSLLGWGSQLPGAALLTQSLSDRHCHSRGTRVWISRS